MCERGDLLLVPFPFSDLSATKRRPVVSLTKSDAYGDFIALPVTSRPQSEFGLALASSDLTIGILPTLSWIRTNRVVTLNSSLVVKTIGQVSTSVLDTAVRHFCTYIGAPFS